MSFTNTLTNLELVSPVMRDAVRRHPEWVEWLKLRAEETRGSDLARDWAEWRGQAGTPADVPTALGAFKSRETIGIALRDVAGMASFEETIARLSELADWVISVMVDVAWEETVAKMPIPVTGRDGFGVIAMGKLGARVNLG